MRSSKQSRKQRFKNILSGADEDPLAGMANLFDAGMVFAVALLLALVSYLSLPELLSKNEDLTIVKNPGDPNMEIIKKEGNKLEKYEMTSDSIGGEGEKLGICYRLKNGEVVYIPEVAETENASKPVNAGDSK